MKKWKRKPRVAVDQAAPDLTPDGRDLPSPPDEAATADREDQERVGALKRRKWLLAGVGIAVIALVIAGSAFAVGYAVGNGADGSASSGSSGQPGGILGGWRANGYGGGSLGGGKAPGGRREQLRKMLESGQVQLVQGEVTGVADGRVTVRTSSGEKTIAVSESTRMMGAGGSAGAGELAAGDKVIALARDASGDVPEALAIRLQGTGWQQGH